MVIHPARTTLQPLTEAKQFADSVMANYIRVSVGTEHIDDIVVDFEKALKTSAID